MTVLYYLDRYYLHVLLNHTGLVQCIQNFPMDFPVARNHLPHAEIVRISVQIGEFPPSLFHQKCPSSNVPAAQIVLPVARQPPAGHPREHERGAPEHPNGPDHRHQTLDAAQAHLQALQCRRRAHGNDRVADRGLFAHLHGVAVQGGAVARLCREALVAVGVVDYSRHHHPLVRDGDGRHTKGHAVYKVCSSIDRIHYPQKIGCGVSEHPVQSGRARLLSRRYALLAKNRVSRKCF
mmetsp:Transcript_31926/g.63246  ORF Transcript_31926/g.63246 Transcript_31926/m.63246 type:complete len:236 (+) Transcript_31926:181-888(+)